MMMRKNSGIQIGNRRGASSAKRNSNNSNTAIKQLLIAGAILVALLIGCMFGMIFSLTGAGGSTTITRHDEHQKNLPGVPNLLRGNVDPVITNDRRNELGIDEQDKQVAQHPLLRGDSAEKLKETTRDLFRDDETTVRKVSGNDYPYDLVEVSRDWTAEEFVPPGGGRFTEYLDGSSPYTISQDTRTKSDAVARSRRYHIKAAMQFVWNNYVQYAFGNDELQPQTGRGSNGWGGQGITLVDALDTLWLMDMKDEFHTAGAWVRDHLDHGKVGAVSMFETTIRDLGGLLSAYDWSGEQYFLDKAVDLGERLLHGFDGSTTGIPFGQVSLKDGQAKNLGWTGGNAILAEFGTIQLEFRYLAKMTGRPELKEKAEKVFEILHEIAPANGLYPYYYRNNPRNSNKPLPANQKLSFGAMADSFYEYMLKIWIQGGKTEPMYREMYDKAMDGMHNELLQKSTPSGLTYIADKNSGNIDPKMDHLVCFMGGLLALGAYTDPGGIDSDRAQRDLKTAKALTYTCYQMYARMNTGISAEFVQFTPGSDFQIGRGAPHYLLRPEVIESFFILNQLTGDPVYREWGWEVFEAIEKYCKTKYGYGALSNVQERNGKPRDKMESFFLAETLKYLYLLQDPETEIDVLHKHVFNTEAHPMRIFPVIDAEEK